MLIILSLATKKSLQFSGNLKDGVLEFQNLQDGSEIVNFFNKSPLDKELKILRISNSSINEIPNVLFDYIKANTVIISGVGLRKVSKQSLANANSVYTAKLILSNNSLSELDSHLFSQLSILQVLDLSFNQIERIDGLFNGCDNLKELNLSYNKVSAIFGDEFLFVRNLTFIDLSYNQISVLGEISLDHPGARIKELILRGNELCMFVFNLSDSFHKNFTIEKIDVSSNRLTSIFMQSDLTKLDASRNKIASIGFADEVTIKEINLSENWFNREVAKLLAKAKDLEVIDLSCNELGNPGDNFYSQFEKLKYLNLSETSITNFTSRTFENQSKIEILDISENAIENLELSWFSSMKLKSLDISDNEIVEIKDPENIWMLPHLVSITLSGNDWDCGFLFKFLDELEKQNVSLGSTVPDTSKSFYRIVKGVGCYNSSVKPSNLTLNERLDFLSERFQNLTILYQKSIKYRETTNSRIYFLVLVSIAALYFALKIIFLVKDRLQHRTLKRAESYRSVMIPLFQ